MKRNFQSKDGMEGFTSPADHMKHDLVKLRSEITGHYSKAYQNPKEMYAFANHVKVFAISLEPYTDKDIIRETMEHYKELEEEIKKIKESTLDKKNKEYNIIRIRYEYAEPVFHQSLRIFHNSPLIEVEATGILKMRDDKLKYRVRKLSHTSNYEIEEEEDEESDN